MIYSWLLLFLIVPVLVHLFSFRRAKKYFFSTLKFVKQVSSSSKSRTRLKYYLILTNRLLLFLAIVLLSLSILNVADSLHFNDGFKVYFDDSASSSIEEDGISVYNSGVDYLQTLGIAIEAIDFDSQHGFSRLSKVIEDQGYDMYVSDFQGISRDVIENLKVDTTTSRSFLMLGNLSGNQNLYVDTLFIELNSSDLSKQRIVLIPGLSGARSEGTAVFRLLNNERQISSVAMDFSELSRIEFDIPIDLKGEFTVRISGDNVYYDNEFFFTLTRRSKPKISILDELGNEYLREVFANENVFDLQILDPGSIDYHAIDESDIIILNSLEKLPSGFVSKIQEKTVMLFPGQNEKDLTLWEGITSTSRLKNASAFNFEIDYKHPLFSGVFSKPQQDTEMPFATPLFKINGDYEVLVSFRGNHSYLIKPRSSNVYLFNSSLDTESSNFASHSLFLPLMYQLAFSSLKYDQQVYYYPNDVMELSVENQEFPPKLSSKTLELIPEFNRSDNGLVIRIPKLDPGFYNLSHYEDSVRVAINISKEESIMEGIQKEELEEIAEKFSHLKILNTDSLTDELPFLEKGLWKYVLILILVFLISETLLHRLLK
ncbi:MAG: BatA domain-containing protein [Ekhidna sp.]|nr:BatA domain-containing protein [Ekhidna sp.]